MKTQQDAHKIPNDRETSAWKECLRETGRFLPRATLEEQEAFAHRQLRVRQRLTRMLRFYRLYPCLMARTHLLTACALTLGRFCGYSAAFDRIGEVVTPVAPDGSPRTRAWEEYVRACELQRPWEVVEELWVIAHVADLEALRSAGEFDAFIREADLHPNDPTWQLLRLHLEVRQTPRCRHTGTPPGPHRTHARSDGQCPRQRCTPKTSTTRSLLSSFLPLQGL